MFKFFYLYLLPHINFPFWEIHPYWDLRLLFSLLLIVGNLIAQSSKKFSENLLVSKIFIVLETFPLSDNSKIVNEGTLILLISSLK